jgi:hypothetical protein
MTNLHPVHALQANPEAARFKVVETLATKEGPLTPDALRELATIDAAPVGCSGKNRDAWRKIEMGQ